MDANKTKALMNKKLSFFLTKPKILVYGIIVGLVVGILGISSLFHAGEQRYRQANTLSPSIVFSRIVSSNEMVSATQGYSIVDKPEDDNTLFDIIHIPFTTNSFWYRYCGTIKVGVDLSKATYDTSGDDGRTITISLDQPYIISNTPDMDKSGVLEENNNLLNPIHVEDVDAFQRKCIEESEKKNRRGRHLRRGQAEHRGQHPKHVQLCARRFIHDRVQLARADGIGAPMKISAKAMVAIAIAVVAVIAFFWLNNSVLSWG